MPEPVVMVWQSLASQSDQVIKIPEFIEYFLDKNYKLADRTIIELSLLSARFVNMSSFIKIFFKHPNHQTPFICIIYITWHWKRYIFKVFMRKRDIDRSNWSLLFQYSLEVISTNSISPLKILKWDRRTRMPMYIKLIPEDRNSISIKIYVQRKVLKWFLIFIFYLFSL